MTWFSDPRAVQTVLIALIAVNALGALWLYVRSGAGRDLLHPFTQHAHDVVSTTVHEKVAMIVETRMTENLIPLILHFSALLGPSWHVMFFTGEEGWEMPQSLPFRQAVDQGRVEVRFLPAETDLSNWQVVSYFLTRTWLWEQVESAWRVLVFQTDSIICANANRTVDDFLEWDFIGAPFSPFFGGEGFNGGLSLRNPKLLLDVLRDPENDYEDLWESRYAGQGEFVEDKFFYAKLSKMPHAKLPDPELAKLFSVEAVWYDRPVGFHAPRMWHPDRMDEIRKYCPEVDLTNNDGKKLPWEEEGG